MHILLFTLALAGTRVGYQDASTQALAAGDAHTALRSADDGLARFPGDAFLLYDRGCALATLGDVDGAVASLGQAARAFPSDHWRATATYRAFLALSQAGRCGEAQTWLDRYARLAPSSDATLARNIGQACRLPGITRR